MSDLRLPGHEPAKAWKRWRVVPTDGLDPRFILAPDAEEAKVKARHMAGELWGRSYVGVVSVAEVADTPLAVVADEYAPYHVIVDEAPAYGSGSGSGSASS